MTNLLSVDELTVDFRAGRGRASLRAVDDVTFHVAERQTVGLVGESGSGKSTIGRAVLGLVRPTHGRITFGGVDLARSTRAQRRLTKANLQVVFQDPFSSLNPARTVGANILEPLSVQGGSRRKALSIALDMLDRVGIPRSAANKYPFEFSGGQRQRIAIARSLTVSPQLVVCDEVVSALDVSTQAQVLNLLRELQANLGVSYFFIAHNLEVVNYVSDRVLVLYRGRVVESGPAEDIYATPRHPYTQALLASAPVANPAEQRHRRQRRVLERTQSEARNGDESSAGCHFAPRCPLAMDVCWTDRPRDTRVGAAVVACHAVASTSQD